MHLVGQHSNPSELLEAVLGWVPDGASGRGSRSIATLPEAERLGNGVVQRAVVGVLADADAAAPLSMLDLHRAVEERLGQPVSKDSVNSCLSTGARGAQPRFARVAPGRYRLAMPLSPTRGSAASARRR